jgi:hypothetical protein
MLHQVDGIRYVARSTELPVVLNKLLNYRVVHNAGH